MGAKVLIVDDNREFLDSIADVLSLEGIDVAMAESGEEAIEITRGRHFDLVLMDVKMPGMNGVECSIELKRRSPDLEILLMTAYRVEKLARQALSEGVRAVLTKPVDVSLVCRHIEQARRLKTGGVILLADDDRAFCDSLCDILDREGYEILLAHDGAEVLKIAGEKPVDILLLDMKLPVLDGLSVYRIIKEERPDLVVIVISAHAVELGGMIDRMVRGDAHAFLSKPVDMDRLMGILAGIGQGAGRGR